MGWGVEGFGFLGGIGGERGHWVMGKFGRKGGGMDPRLDRLGLKMGPSAHCHFLLHTATSDLDS